MFPKTKSLNKIKKSSILENSSEYELEEEGKDSIHHTLKYKSRKINEIICGKQIRPSTSISNTPQQFEKENLVSEDKQDTKSKMPSKMMIN